MRGGGGFALLKQMSPEAQAALGAALGSAVAAPVEEGEAEEAGEEAAEEAEEVAADESQDAAMLAPVLAELAALKAALEAAGIKVGAPKADELPPPAGAAKMDAEIKAQVAHNKAEMQALRADIAKGDPGGLLQARLDGLAVATASLNKTARKDSATVTTPTAKPIVIDPAKIIADATEAASKRFDASAAFVQVVRMDHAEVATVEQAATVMLTTIKAHLPGLAPMAEEALKADRMDSLTTIYKEAEGKRRDGLIAAQGQGLGRVLAQASLDGGNATGNIVRAPASRS